MKQLGASALSDGAVEGVSGGAGMSMSGKDTAKKYSELNDLWNEWDFEGHGISPHQLDAIFEEWEHNGFPGTAKEWLSKYKNW